MDKREIEALKLRAEKAEAEARALEIENDELYQSFNSRYSYLKSTTTLLQHLKEGKREKIAEGDDNEEK